MLLKSKIQRAFCILSLVFFCIPFKINAHDFEDVDVLLIGTGIMSATLGTLLEQLDPNLKIVTLEKLDQIAAESSHAPNNAGTGHSALCELNYTPIDENGNVDTSKAIKIMEKYEVSKQFWAYLVTQGILKNPKDFIHSVPHLSWVHGEEDIEFLKKRFEALHKIPLFAGMEMSQDTKTLTDWMPLMMKGRPASDKVAATRSELGTDVDFGKLTRLLFDYLSREGGLNLLVSHEVKSLKQNDEGEWEIKVKDLKANKTKKFKSKFVFIGAGGGALPLLQKAGIKEALGYGGFPIAGQFLVSKNHELANQHFAKVYGKAAAGAPPMSVPHLDTRIIDGKKELLFGPFAGFSTKFLKKGSHLDLFKSLKLDNVPAMLKAAIQNIPLMKYLFQQVTLTHEDRMEALREFMPDAKSEDWELIDAGQRVQIIKDDPNNEEGVLRFGTEVIESSDGTLSALLGASPGASVSVSVMLEVIQRSFKDKFNSESWQKRIKEIIPSFGIKLAHNDELTHRTRSYSQEYLQLNPTHPTSFSRCENALEN
ncbi:MAG: malate dehydrogenase (quinone) [Proteobacteria bacterium]|nr:malate dehydrogenase (quinone) [Pseudomonadota bacterium]